ncbi:hypothetical protein [Paenibacillus kyungheensis]
MSNVSIIDLSKNEEKLERFLFKHLSFKNILDCKIRTFLNSFAFIFLIATYFLMSCNILFPTSMFTEISPLIPLTITFLLLFINSWVSYTYIRKKYSDYNIKYDLLVNYTSFIQTFRTEQLRIKISRFRISPSNIEDYIEYYESQWNEKIQRKWTKIGIITILLLPIWTEYVSKNIGNFFDQKFLLVIILAITIAIIIILFRSLIETVFFIEVNKKKKTADILKMLKRSFHTVL